MKQSDLIFKQNTKSCVWCEFNDIEFYWEARSNWICITPDNYTNIYIPDGFSAADVRREIVSWLKGAFNA